MLSSYLTMQNAIMQQNMITSRMMGNMDYMRSNMACQPLGGPDTPNVSFSSAVLDGFELQNKADETKISVLKRIADAMQAKLGKDISRSTPKYGGLDIKA